MKGYEINVTSSNADEILEVIRNCQTQFKQCHYTFKVGEEESYAYELSRVGKEIIPQLMKFVTDKGAQIEFICQPRLHGNCSVSLISGEMKIEVFSQFYDTFNRQSPAEIVNYCEQSIFAAKYVLGRLS